MARTVACALVNSRLDYANAVLAIQHVCVEHYETSACAERSSLRRQFYEEDGTYPHWLPVSFRIDYRSQR